MKYNKTPDFHNFALYWNYYFKELVHVLGEILRFLEWMRYFSILSPLALQNMDDYCCFLL